MPQLQEATKTTGVLGGVELSSFDTENTMKIYFQRKQIKKI